MQARGARQRAVGLAVAVALAATVVGAPAGAAEPGGCTSGPATQASAQRPHLVDPAGDGYGGAALPDRDLLSAWISSTGWPDHVVAVNLQLAAGPGQGQVEYVVEYGDDRYVWARGSAAGGLHVDYGPVQRTVVADQELLSTYPVDGTTTGTVTSGGLVRIVLPASTLPTQADAALPFRVWTRTAASVIGWWGGSVLVDDTTNAQHCTAVLDRPSS